MLTQKTEDKLKEMLTKQWVNKYFHNDRTLTLAEMNRDVERANGHARANGSAALFTRLKAHLREKGRIELGAVRTEIATRNKNEVREWLKQFGSIQVFHDVCKTYDFAVQEVRLAFDRNHHRVKITVQTKNNDEGYFGGRQTLMYEVERIREERKVELQRQELEKLSIN